MIELKGGGKIDYIRSNESAGQAQLQELSRQSRRAKQLATLEKQVKELTYLLGVTTTALEKAAILAGSFPGPMSADTVQRFEDVLKLVNQKKREVLGQ